MNTLRILIIEDDEQIRDLLERGLRGGPFDVVLVSSGEEGLQALRTHLFDVALVDINLGDITGLEVLEATKHYDPGVDVIMMTGQPQVDSAIQALRLGASDYLTKPLALAGLKHLLSRVAERRYLRAEVSSLRSRLGESSFRGELIGHSPLVERVREIVAKVADSDSAVLIEGESGTGKELVAESLHRLSRRAEMPFVPVNCAAIPPELIESELFGHVKGSFSSATSEYPGLFRAAEGGTLLLDEISELPLQLQPKLLRVLQQKEVRPVGSSKLQHINFRLIAATNQPLEAAVEAGKFRQDLFFRLNVVRIETPPLRHVKEDIPQLVTHFVRKLNQRFTRNVQVVDADVMAALEDYDFPGNVRELENLMERAYALGAEERIELSDFPPLRRHNRLAAAGEGDTVASVRDFERNLIAEAMQEHGRNKQAVATALGLSERTLYRRIKALGLG